MDSALDISLAIITCVLYAAAAWRYALRFFHHTNESDVIAKSCAWLGCGSHGVFLIATIMSGDVQNMSMANVFSLVAWLMTLSMMVSSFYFNNTILMPVIFGLSIAAVCLSVLIPDVYAVNVSIQPGLVVHIALSLFAYGILLIALLYALQVNYISHQLKQKDGAILNSPLPPLMMLDRILIKLLYASSLLLFVAIFSGSVFLDDMLNKQHAHKTVLSIIALSVLLGTLLGQKLWGWRGKHLTTLVGIATLCLTLAYFGSRFVREVLL